MGVYKGNGIYNKQSIYKGTGIYKGDGIYKDEIVLPPFTMRFKANRAVSLSDFRSLPITLTLVDDARNIYDVKLEQADWGRLFQSLDDGGNTWLVEILGANTSGVKNMANTFNGCIRLESIALFDTSNVTDFSNTFIACKSLTTLPLFDTSSARTLTGFAAYCSLLKEVPLFDTRAATDMSLIFYESQSLTSVPLFNTSKATTVHGIFSGCRKVERGALALYTQMSTQATPPSTYRNAFTNCGRDTPAGLAELQQIPASWGGLAGALTMMSTQGENETDPETGLAELQQNQIDDTPDGANN